MLRQKSKKAQFSGNFSVAVVKQLPRNKLDLGERGIRLYAPLFFTSFDYSKGYLT